MGALIRLPRFGPKLNSGPDRVRGRLRKLALYMLRNFDMEIRGGRPAPAPGNGGQFDLLARNRSR